MLVVWATSDAQLLRRTIGAALLAMRPETPPHRFEPVTDDPLVAETGEVVLVCGTRPLEVAKKAGLVPKNRALGSLREALFRPKLGGHYQITYDPAITDSDPTSTRSSPGTSVSPPASSRPARSIPRWGRTAGWAASAI